jgi:acyl-CoA reductase-like NAD-dependent aldehyde dehydrogenase
MSKHSLPEHSLPDFLIINGERVRPGATFDVLNPATGSALGSCPQGDVILLDSAVAAAAGALPAWRDLPDVERSQKLELIASQIEDHRAELAELIVAEQGKPRSGLGADFEVQACSIWTRATAKLSLPEEIVQDDAGAKVVIRRKPVGVVASITPWNWPVLIAVWHVMPALKAGCTVVIKPSPYTPFSTLKLVEIMNAVLPPGVINVVTGDGEVGQRMTTHPDVNKVVFTGSTATGKNVMRHASGTLKRLTLELGGNDAGIVLPGTTISPLLEKLFWGCFINSGQTCGALKRLYVHTDQHDEVVAQLAELSSKMPMGDGADLATVMGPLSNRMQLDKVVSYVNEARSRGARIACGGSPLDRKGFFYPLTVIGEATDDMLVVKEEQFGPVIPVLRYDDVEDAVRRANSLDAGLGGSVWGNNVAECEAVASRLECGTAWVNQHGTLNPLAPFGGIKASGIGVEFNVDGLKEYTTVQVMNIAK